MSSDILTVTILSKEYQIQCPIDQHQRLTEASLVLDKKMKTIKNEGKIKDTTKIAIMIALNLTYESITSEHEDIDPGTTQAQLKKLNNKIDDALNSLLQLHI
jgi:cell division protein ZapA